MKKILALLLSFVIILSLCACGGEAAKDKDEPVAETESANKLSEKEEQLLNFLIKMVSDDFFEPAAVRVLEIGDYNDRAQYENDKTFADLKFGPDTIVLRLQGENKVGGTVNHYYKICLTTAENTSDYAKSQCKLYDSQISLYKFEGKTNDVNAAIGKMMDYKGEAGDYVELSDSYKIEVKADDYNIGNINKAFAKYWEDLGIG